MDLGTWFRKLLLDTLFRALSHVQRDYMGDIVRYGQVHLGMWDMSAALSGRRYDAAHFNSQTERERERER